MGRPGITARIPGCPISEPGFPLIPYIGRMLLLKDSHLEIGPFIEDPLCEMLFSHLI